jgi:hypothetical protein
MQSPMLRGSVPAAQHWRRARPVLVRPRDRHAPHPQALDELAWRNAARLREILQFQVAFGDREGDCVDADLHASLLRWKTKESAQEVREILGKFGGPTPWQRTIRADGVALGRPSPSAH